MKGVRWMSLLQKRMLEELQLRNLSESTICTYLDYRAQKVDF
jgi:hypothetical protein